MSLDYHNPHHDRILPAAWEERIARMVARIWGVALLSAVSIAWLSVLSWSTTDPSLTHATPGEASNLLGYFGASLSDLLLQTFGLAVALVLLPPMFWGLELTFAQRINALGSKATYFPLAILICAGAMSAVPVANAWPLNHGWGGILGDAVYQTGSNIIAITAPDRAGLLTGFLFFGLGFACLAYSIGVELTDIVGIARSRAQKLAKATRREPTLAPLHQPWPDRSTAFGSHLGHIRRHFQDARARIGAGVEHAMAHTAAHNTHAEPAPDAHRHTHAHRACHAPNGYPHQGPNTGNAYQNQPAAPLQHAPQYGFQNAAGDRGPAPQPSTEPQAPHHADAAYGLNAASRQPNIPSDPDNSAVEHDTGFDGTTDTTSRMIAARFAPESARAPASANPAAATQSPPSHCDPAQHQPHQPQTDPGREHARHSAREPAPSQPAPPKARRANTPGYKQPSLNVLKRGQSKQRGPHQGKTALRGNARLLEDVLSDFGIKGEVVAIRPGPVVTVYELEPARGTKASRIIGLASDIARSMSAKSARIAVIEGRNVIGIELPNTAKQTVTLRDVLETDAFRKFNGTLPVTLGMSVTGDPIVADLSRMPHLLVAGTTGSGKSVGISAMITSLLYRFGPDDCRMLMIDPKMLELSVYNGIPHLLTPVITDPHKAVAALNWAVGEMEERNKRMSKMNVRSIEVFNNRVRNAKKRGELIARTVQTGFDRHSGHAIYEQQHIDMEPMPYIVIVIDEFADLMAAAGKELEAAVQRLAQMARAAGIHLIMATQRPSVDVITGTIKANFPCRASFKVASKVDSRTILNEQGAEHLLGEGDMLYSTGAGTTTRVHGPFVSDAEVESVVAHLRENHTENYVDELARIQEEARAPDADAGDNANTDSHNARSAPSRADDELYDRAVTIALRDRKATTSYLQRRLSIGYNRAADLMERLEDEKIIGPSGPSGKREILVSLDAADNEADDSAA